jgi:Ca2+-binding RTX toxin-like protein
MSTFDDEVTYISGLNSSGSLAQIAYSAWDRNNPATYSPPYNHAAKWQSGPSANLAGTPGGVVSYYFDPASNWNTTEKQDFIAGLTLWSAVANITFAQTTNAGAAQITISRGNDGEAHTGTNLAGPSDAGLIGGSKLLQITSATISIDTSVSGFGPITSAFTTYGGYPWEALLHEEGHALGLGHAGPYPFTGVSNSSTLQYSPYDSRQWTIMSYVEPFDTTAVYYGQYPVSGTNWGLSPTAPDGHAYHNEATTLMVADILAIQRIYGLPTSTPLSGGQVFGFNSNITGAIAPFFNFAINVNPVVTLWDMGMNNTLDLTGFSSSANVNLNPGTFSSCDGLTNNICIAFNTAIDRLLAGAGSDTILGNNNGDYLSGGGGNDTITGGAGNDTLVGGTGSNTLDGGGGTNTAIYAGIYSSYAVVIDAATGRDIISGNGVSDALTNVRFLQFADTTISTVQNLFLTGSAGNDVLTGGDGDDTLRGGGGTNVLDGRGGNDTAAFSLFPGNYYVTTTGNGYLVQGPGETDTLINIEQASFDPRGIIAMSQFIAESFNPLAYVASYGDLIRGIGANQNAAVTHYMTAGYYEGRTTTFNALQYTASYSDLIRAFGTNQTAAATHYINAGYSEGRRASFNALQYIASYTDLINGLGDNQTAAYEHYIKYGNAEGRSASFNALQYVASYSDLIQGLGDNQTAAYEHYILAGSHEGRSASFNALQYIASYSDLVTGLGDNQTGAYEHYIKYGYGEGRSASFNALAYTASYADLIHGLGDNPTAAYEHYIKYGNAEGRHVIFDPVAYLLSYSDLQNAGLTAQTAAAHYIDAGFQEGRSASGVFGTEQSQHILTLGTQAASSLTSGDKDWFSIDLTAGHTYDLSLSGATPGNLADPFLELRNSHGVLLAQDNDSGPGTDALIHFTASTTTGTYYLVAASNVPGATGNYKVLAANG